MAKKTEIKEKLPLLTIYDDLSHISKLLNRAENTVRQWSDEELERHVNRYNIAIYTRQELEIEYAKNEAILATMKAIVAEPSKTKLAMATIFSSFSSSETELSKASIKEAGK